MSCLNSAFLSLKCCNSIAKIALKLGETTSFKYEIKRLGDKWVSITNCFILYIYYDEGTNAGHVHKKFVLLTVKMRYQKWFFTFVLKTSISKLALHSGLLFTEKVYQIIAQVEPELWWTNNYGVAKGLSIHYQTVQHYLKKLVVWNNLIQNNLLSCISICKTPKERNKFRPLLRVIESGAIICKQGKKKVRFTMCTKKPDWRQRRSCNVFSGPGEELCIVSCFYLTKCLIRTSTGNN